MDLSTIVGIVAAFGLMIMAIMSGSGITIFIDFAALIVVSGGTLGATLVHYPFKEVSRAFGVLKKAFFHKEEKPSDYGPGKRKPWRQFVKFQGFVSQRNW